MGNESGAWRLAAVIPCYRTRAHILSVLQAIPPEVHAIYCIDDACPEGTGALIESNCTDSRVRVLRHECNQGVGGATVTGYRAALEDGADIVVKLDSDGQMDPELIPQFVHPIMEGEADYTKGNRFFRLEDVAAMPKVRLFGNAILSFVSKLSTGYWQTFDPTNGYTAIHAEVVRALPLGKLHRRYFFETDMLYRLNTIRAVVLDVPVRAIYGTEESGLSILPVIPQFARGHLVNFAKRMFYNYFLRDFHVASVEWILGPLLMLFGVAFGVSEWIENYRLGTAATAGTVMVAALPMVMGLQLTLSALSFDIQSLPRTPIHRLLIRRKWDPVKRGDAARVELIRPLPSASEETAQSWRSKRNAG